MRAGIGIGALLICAGTILGAFGAHGLKSVVTPELLAVYEKGVFYQLITGVGMLGLSLSAPTYLSESLARRLVILLTISILIFSGTLYLLTVTGERWLGAITPIGGAGMITTWAWFSLAVLRGSAR